MARMFREFRMSPETDLERLREAERVEKGMVYQHANQTDISDIDGQDFVDDYSDCGKVQNKNDGQLIDEELEEIENYDDCFIKPQDQQEIKKENKMIDFDGDKILSEYDSMSRDDVIGLLGEEKALIVKEGIEKGNISFEQFTQICHDAFPEYPQRADWVRNLIFNKLSQTEGFNMFEQDPENKKFMLKQNNFVKKHRTAS